MPNYRNFSGTSLSGGARLGAVARALASLAEQESVAEEPVDKELLDSLAEELTLSA